MDRSPGVRFAVTVSVPPSQPFPPLLPSALSALPTQPCAAIAAFPQPTSPIINHLLSPLPPQSFQVSFDDIASLEDAKRLLNEAITLPMLMPEYFTGIREPWRGVLLFGPPGTGKTLLAKAAASVAGVAFLNCSPATLTSKWRGESEKLVRARHRPLFPLFPPYPLPLSPPLQTHSLHDPLVLRSPSCMRSSSAALSQHLRLSLPLRISHPASPITHSYPLSPSSQAQELFALARQNAPAVIFIDEVDALAGGGGGDGDGGDSEASRRFRAELLSQMDGIRSAGDGPLVIVLATTNRPWALDEAMRRRLEKRIHVALPDAAARAEVVRIHLRGVSLDTDVELSWIASNTDGYSGADLKVLCKDASLMPMRRLLASKSQAEIVALKGSRDLQVRETKEAKNQSEKTKAGDGGRVGALCSRAARLLPRLRLQVAGSCRQLQLLQRSAPGRSGDPASSLPLPLTHPMSLLSLFLPITACLSLNRR